MKIIIDTSVIVDYIRSDGGMLPQVMQTARSKSSTLYIPTVVILELWKGSSMQKKDIETKVDRLLSVMKEVCLTKQIAKDAGKMIRIGQMDNFIDSVITASALELNASLATLNKKHFTKVKGLKLFELQKK